MKYTKIKSGGITVYSPIREKAEIKWWHITLLFGIILTISIIDSIPF